MANADAYLVRIAWASVLLALARRRRAVFGLGRIATLFSGGARYPELSIRRAAAFLAVPALDSA